MSAPKLYDRGTSAYINNGLGVLSDCRSYEVSETINGKFELTLEYPLCGEMLGQLQINRIIYAEINPYGNWQPFRIYSISKPLGGIVTVRAEHKGYELSGYVCMADDTYIETTGTAAQYMQYLTQQVTDTASALQMPTYSFATDIMASANWQIEKPISVREAMTRAVQIFGGEWEYNGDVCTLRAHRGQNRGVNVRYGSNLISYQQDETDDTYTHIMPYWTDGTTEVFAANKYIIVSSTTGAMQKRVKIVDLSDRFVDAPTPAELETEARQSDEYLKPKTVEITQNVQFIPLGQTTEYAYLYDADHVELGDEVGVYIPVLDVQATARCNRLVYDGMRGYYKTATLGTIPETIASAISSRAGNTGVNVFVSVDAPREKIKGGDYWIKIDNDTTRNAISVGRYSGGNWLLLCKFSQGGEPARQRQIYISADEPGENAASGDFWVSMPDSSTVSALYLYGNSWEKKLNYTYGSQPSQTPAEGSYWVQIFGGELGYILQYVNGAWTNPSYQHNIFSDTNDPPTDGDLWVEINDDTAKKAKGLYTYTSADGWTLGANAGGGVGEALANGSENFSSYSGTQYANTDTNGYKNHLEGQENALTNCQLTHVDGYHNTGTGALYCSIHGLYNDVSGTANIVAGDDNDVSGGKNAVFGYHNDVDNSTSSNVVAGANHTVKNYQSDAVVCGDGATCRGEAVFYVAGNGTNTATIDRFGYVTAAAYNTAGADYAEYFEWIDGNPDNEDRRGLLVSLIGDKIQLATGDDIDGIISVNPSVCGNDCELRWHGKYKTDVFGQVQKDEAGKPIISDDYDKSKKYIPRSQRKEWATVGMLGQLVAVDDGSCQVGGYVSARNGIAHATFANTGIKVLKRLDDTHIRVKIGGR